MQKQWLKENMAYLLALVLILISMGFVGYKTLQLLSPIPLSHCSEDMSCHTVKLPQ